MYKFVINIFLLIAVTGIFEGSCNGAFQTKNGMKSVPKTSLSEMNKVLQDLQQRLERQEAREHILQQRLEATEDTLQKQIETQDALLQEHTTTIQELRKQVTQLQKYQSSSNGIENTAVDGILLQNTDGISASHSAGSSFQTGAVAFSVARTTALEVTEITAIEYDIIEVNIGSGFDTINKKHFTAPVNGYYVFHSNGLTESGSSVSRIKVNGVVKASCAGDPSGTRDSISMSTMTLLQTGDIVTVELDADKSLYSSSSRYTTFTGFLLYSQL